MGSPECVTTVGKKLESSPQLAVAAAVGWCDVSTQVQRVLILGFRGIFSRAWVSSDENGSPAPANWGMLV
jgi:hypothetical protein